MSIRILLTVCFALSCIPVFAQNAQIRQRVEQCLAESQQNFGTRKYEAGASRVVEAARIVKARPSDFPQYSPVSLLSTAVDFLNRESGVAKSRGDDESSNRALNAQLILLRTLSVWEPQNSKWSQMSSDAQRGDSANESAQRPSMPANFNPYVPDRSGPSIGGTNSRYANTGPGSGSQYHPVHITPSSLKSGPWGPGLGRARVDWSRLPLPHAGSGGGSQGSNCPSCGHYMAPGVSWCASCGH